MRNLRPTRRGFPSTLALTSALLSLSGPAFADEPDPDVPRPVSGECAARIWDPETERQRAWTEAVDGVEHAEAWLCSFDHCAGIDVRTAAVRWRDPAELPEQTWEAPVLPAGISFAPDGSVLTISDPATGAPRHRIDFMAMPYDSPCMTGDVRSLRADRLLVGTYNCGGPAGVTYLVDTELGNAVRLGGKGFDSYAIPMTQLHDDVWLFVASSGHDVITVDVGTREVLARVDLSAVYPVWDWDPTAHMHAYGDQGPALLPGPDGTHVLVHGAPRSGLVTVLDPSGTAVRNHWALFDCQAASPAQ
jgi:hypothetical protein